MHKFLALILWVVLQNFQAAAEAKVMFSDNYPPFNYLNNKGELVGFNVELLECISKLYNSNINIVHGAWESINSALENGEIAAIGSVHYPGSIDNNFIYTRATVTNSHCFLYNSNFHKQFSPELLRSLKAPQVVLWESDVLMHYVLSINPSTKFIFVDNYPQLLNALEDKKVSGALTQRIGSMYYASLLERTHISATNNQILERNMGFKIAKQHSELAEQINNGLEVLIANGEYQRIYDKWIRGYSKNESVWEKYSKYFLSFILVITLTSISLVIINRVLQNRVRSRTEDLLLQLELNAQIVKELEVQKSKAEESEKMKSAFLANMSHEIRTPLNGILGFTELLETDDYKKEERLQFINIIKQSGKRMLNTINNIIDVSKLETGAEVVKINKVDLKDILAEMHNFFSPEAKAKNLALIFDGKNEMEDCIFYTDEYKLNSILTNLIKNALKFTRKGHIKVEYFLHCDYLEFKISDTGIGIEKKKQKEIFNQFVQADSSLSSDFEGSGLGLSITKGYVKMLNGEISMESELNVGTTFRVKLPSHKQASA